MRISDWSSDVCSSDLTPLPSADASSLRFRIRGADAKLHAGRARAVADPERREPADTCARRIARGAALPSREAEGLSDPCRQRLCARRSEEHTSELQSLMRISYAVFCLKKKNNTHTHTHAT